VITTVVTSAAAVAQRGPHLGSSLDAIPSCKLIDHRADSRCVVRSLPNPEP
jgi:hypothetical protein